MAEEPEDDRCEVVDKLMSGEHADVVRESVAWMVAELMEAEVAGQIGAELGERTGERVTQRNGYRARPWDTRVGRARAARSRSCARAAISRAFWSRAGGPSRRWSRSSRRPTSTASRTRKVDRLVEQMGCRHEQGPGLAAVPRPGRAGAEPSASARWRAATPTSGWTARSRRSASAAACARSAW